MRDILEIQDLLEHLNTVEANDLEAEDLDFKEWDFDNTKNAVALVIN